MCFSPEVDVVAGALITVIGLDTMRQARTARFGVLGALPVLFGIHQLLEALVWLHLEGRVGSVGAVAAGVYAAIAFVLIPVVVPFAFAAAGLVRWHQVAYLGLMCGVIASGMGLSGMTRAPVASCIVGHHISYDAHIPSANVMVTLYIVATCMGPLVARSRWLQLWGVANLAAVLILIALARSGLTSLWCLWAGITSVIIDIYLRDATRSSTPRRVHAPR